VRCALSARRTFVKHQPSATSSNIITAKPSMALKVEQWVPLPDLTANANDIISLFRQL